MPEVSLLNSGIVKKVKYNENQILNSAIRSGVPGLQDELTQFPVELLRFLRSICGVHNDTDALSTGLQVKSFDTKINTSPGYLVLPEEIYRLDGLVDYIPQAGASWGNIEIEILTSDEEDQYIPVFSTADKVVNNTLLPTKKYFKATIYDNFSLTPSFPAVGSGRYLWLQYKMSGFTITSVENKLQNYLWGA